MTGVLSWEDVIKERALERFIVWFGALVMMATFLNKLGPVAWFAGTLEKASKASAWLMGASALLLLAYLYAHYLFASTMAHYHRHVGGPSTALSAWRWARRPSCSR